jgi:hypothetical protein
MYKNDVIKYYGSGVEVAAALKISSASVSQWSDVIPEKQALHLERKTNGKLKYEASFYEQVS